MLISNYVTIFSKNLKILNYFAKKSPKGKTQEPSTTSTLQHEPLSCLLESKELKRTSSEYKSQKIKGCDSENILDAIHKSEKRRNWLKFNCVEI